MGTLYSVNGSTGDITTAGSITSTSTTSGFTPPKLTTTQRDAIVSPTSGMTIYNTTTNTVQTYNGTIWIDDTVTSTNAVTSLHADANPNLTSDVQLVSGTNITLSQVGQAITINASGGGTPAGLDQQVQFNDGGVFGASPNFLFDKRFTLLTLTGVNDGVNVPTVRIYADDTLGTATYAAYNNAGTTKYGSIDFTLSGVTSSIALNASSTGFTNGNVVLTTTNGSSSTWIFDIDGTTTFPAFIKVPAVRPLDGSQLATLTTSEFLIQPGVDGTSLFVVTNAATATIFQVDSVHNAVSIGPSSADPSAVLDVQSTTKGFLPPRMTTAEKTAIVTPATGLVVYDTTLNKLSLWTGAAWETVTSA